MNPLISVVDSSFRYIQQYGWVAFKRLLDLLGKGMVIFLIVFGLFFVVSPFLIPLLIAIWSGGVR